MDITSHEAKVHTDSTLELNGLLARFGLEDFDRFKEAITTVLGRKDCLVLMPTGGGKSFATNYLP